MENFEIVRNDLARIIPLLVICGVACIVLLGDSLVPAWRRARWLNPVISLAGLFAALSLAIRQGGEGEFTAWAGSIAIDALSISGAIALLVTGVLSVLMATNYLRGRGIDHGEYYVLILFSIAGAMLMASARDLIILFIGLEILSFALYVLAGFARSDARSQESSIKYFLLGAFASAFFLYGIALIYGATQSTNLEAINVALKGDAGRSPMMFAGVALVLIGLGFKAAVIPFHQWTPDVYEGAPTTVTAYMAAGAKIGAFVAMLRVFGALGPMSGGWLPAVQVLAILTMVFGNLLAIQQTNVKRMLAYSSIAHAGYLLVAVAALGRASDMTRVGAASAHGLAINGALFYLFAYVFMTLGAFGVLVYLSNRGREYEELEDLRGLARTDPKAAYSMLFFMLSLGGIPPTMGFWGKWQIFLAAIAAGEITLAVVLALSSVMAVYYYLKIVWMMAFDEPVERPVERPARVDGAEASMLIAAVATLVFGIFPHLISSLTTTWSQ